MDGQLAARTPVQDFYRGQSVFVTGGSGFMGKVLIEKLLYACPDLLSVYVLMRPKRGKSIENRLDEIFKLPLFQRIRDECPQVLKKVFAVHGDITLEGLGLSATSRQQLCERVTIVYHLAATLKLEAPLKDAIEMNLNGTRRVLDLCNEMPKLRQMVHLSTAFCNCDQNEMGEQVYDYPHRPADLLQCTAWMDDRVLARITGDLLRPHVNAYTYSKRLAEILVRDQYPRLPVTIVRPSIVTPSWSEPIPGWVDSLNGPIGIMAGAAKGVIRTMLINGENPSEIIPVDMAINGLITIPYDICRRDRLAKVESNSNIDGEMPVFNVTCCESQKTTWKRVLELGESINAEYPIEAGVWYPGGSMTTSVVMHTMRAILFHWFPAYVIDFLLFCFGQKRFMLRVQQKVSTGLEVLSFFTLRRWNFKSEQYASIFRNLGAEDKILFNMDMEAIDVAEYMKRSILGGRQYCLKEPLTTLPKARMQLKALYMLDRLTKLFLLWLLLSYVMLWTDARNWLPSLF